MASKNMKKVLRKIYSQNKNFHPTQAPVSWNKSVKYIKAKDKRLTYNAMFKPLFEQIKQEMREEGCHEKVLKARAKEKAKELVKAKLAAAATPAEQDYKESQGLLQEG